MIKKRMIKTVTLFLAVMVLLTGCEKAPEAANDDGILRAKGGSDDAIEAVVNDEEEKMEAGEKTPGEIPTGSKAEETFSGGGTVNVTLGEGENRMRIEAEVKAAPEAVGTLIMQADSRLSGETLRSFLDPQGEVKDYTEELLAAEEAERKRVAEIDEKLGEGSSIVEIAGVGDGSTLALTDGNRKAVLVGKTGASFEDAFLQEKCRAVMQENVETEQELNVKDEKAGESSFSLQEAKALLMEKLSVLGIEDIHLTKAYFYGADDLSFYELQFCPVVDGLPVAYCFGQHDISRVYPNGLAWVSAEGVAEIGLWNCLMEQVSAGEEDTILGFDKVQELLRIYLKDGRLQCTEDIPFSTAELVYYVELKDGKLELSPVWGIYMDLEEYVDYCGQAERIDFVWTIHIDAVKGEILEVQ